MYANVFSVYILTKICVYMYHSFTEARGGDRGAVATSDKLQMIDLYHRGHQHVLSGVLPNDRGFRITGARGIQPVRAEHLAYSTTTQRDAYIESNAAGTDFDFILSLSKYRPS